MTQRRKNRKFKNATVHITSIQRALRKTPVDVKRLRQLSHSGFVAADIRKKVWPHLLGISDDDKYQDLPLSDDKIDKNHKYYDQINKDIDRSLFHFDITKKYKKAKRSRKRAALHRIIHTIFTLHKDLHYIQGYHDVCSVFLLVCDDEKEAYLLCERISLMHIRDSLRPTLDVVISIMSLLFPLIELADEELHNFFKCIPQMQSFFSLSWILTWFSHDIGSYSDICLVFDFFLASHPLMPLYMSTALILEMRTELLSLPKEMSAVHQYFRIIPTNVDIERLLKKAKSLYSEHPPHLLYRRTDVTFPKDSPLFVHHVSELHTRIIPLIKKRKKNSKKI